MSGCGGSGGASIGVVIHAPPPLDSSGQCPETAPKKPLSRGPDGPTTLRLTYRQSAGPLVCDAIVPLEGAEHLVGVPRRPDGAPLGRLDLVVEAFRGDAAAGAVLVGSGVARDVDLEAGGEIQVFVAPRDQFGCTQRPSVRGRAFHSLTTLPSGDVLMIGGLVPNPNDGAVTEIALDNPVTTGGFYATASVERYDPETATFSEVIVPGLSARAFHGAYLVPGDPVRILVVGGLAPVGDPAAQPVADAIRDAAEPLRLVPTLAAMPAPSQVITLTGPDQGTVTTLEGDAAFAPRMFGAATRAPSLGDDPGLTPAGPPLFAGGWAAYPNAFTGTFETADLGTVSSTGTPLLALVPPTRVGATATWIGEGRALVWGGNLGSAAGQEAPDSGNVIAGLASGMPTATKVTFDMAGVQPAPRAFHSAVAVGPDSVLVVGGYTLAGGSTGEPQSPFAERIRFPVGGAQAVVEAIAPAGAVPVGFTDAVPLLGGGVLVSGGNPASGAAGAPCPDGTIGFALCSVADAWRFDPVAATFTRTASLGVRRWGHRSAVLRDGTVLVTGGFENRGARLFVVRAAEVYNPRSEAKDAAADALAPNLPARAAGDIARRADGSAASPCPVVEP